MVQYHRDIKTKIDPGLRIPYLCQTPFFLIPDKLWLEQYSLVATW